jgi:hypothetical protein
MSPSNTKSSWTKKPPSQQPSPSSSQPHPQEPIRSQPYYSTLRPNEWANDIMAWEVRDPSTQLRRDLHSSPPGLTISDLKAETEALADWSRGLLKNSFITIM